MPSSTRDQSARAHDSPPPAHHADRGSGGGEEKGLASLTPKRAVDKIRCLDGLRGIACLIVFNYHFFWPWTPAIMLGYGALPPRSPEPHWGWPSLPIVCLLHRGRPMVAIFFAISGYVLTRHILRSIKERRLDLVYQKLASAVFRRVFRLYIPPTISMFIVAILAQVGVFRSEEAIFMGPDSAYINATITVIEVQNGTCGNYSLPVSGATGMAAYMGLESPKYLANISEWTDVLCINQTSRLFGPSSLYILEEPKKEKSNDTALNETTTLDTLAPYPYGKNDKSKKTYKPKYHGPTSLTIDDSSNTTEPINLTWVALGGSWEEHPFIHDNMTYALKNFTRAYAEWANPFNFGHYHPRYDPHTFTIPMELRGSMFVYLFLLGTAALKLKWRFRFAAFFTGYSLVFGRWDMATFMGGTLLSEIDIRNSFEPPSPSNQALPPASGSMRRRVSLQSSRGESLTWWVVLFVALYFLSYPDAGAEYTPGFAYLSTWVPKYYIPLSGWMFYQSMGALMLVRCILRSPVLCGFLEGRVPQYLGRISFSLYLVHGPILHSLGFWIMPRLFDNFGKMGGYAIGWITLLSITLYLTDLWYRKVDLWSMTVGRKVEQMLTE